MKRWSRSSSRSSPSGPTASSACRWNARFPSRIGTVVAGIPVSGIARTGDELVLLPAGIEGRIRRIEVYGAASETVLAGQCAAINMGHWDHRQIGRGDTVATPGYFAPQEWFAATLRLLPNAKLTLKNGAKVRFHTGTSEVNAAVYSLKGDRMAGGDECLVQLRVAAPLIAGPADRYILRSLSPVRTIGGGMILEAIPGRLKRSRPDLHADIEERARAVGDDRRFVEYCVRKAESLTAAPADLARRTKIPQDRVAAILGELAGEGRIVALTPGVFIHRNTAAEAAERILAAIAEFHRQSPESPGLTFDELRQTCGIDKPVLEKLIALLAGNGRLVEAHGRLALPEHLRRCLMKTPRTWRPSRRSSAMLFAPPSNEEVVARVGISAAAVEKILKILREHGRLVFGRGAAISPRGGRFAREILVAHLQREGRLDSVQFKYLLDTTRKFALPLLDHFDRIGVTPAWAIRDSRREAFSVDELRQRALSCEPPPPAVKWRVWP